jgi:regulator of protease activity HflC (stomatin/prohibitin superfamily)
VEGQLLLIVVGAIFLLWIVFSTFRIISDYKRLVILSLGRYSGTRGPGVVIVLPFIERAMEVDLREKFLDIPSQTAITKDNASIDIDFLVYYRIVEPALSVLKVENVEKASVLMATTTLRAVIGDIELDDVLSKRESINDTLRVKLDESTERWGVKITSVEIREIVPPRDVMDAMTRQMTAERQRRAEVTRALGEREAAISIAEGQKQAEILKAEGERQAAIARAEGERQAQLLRAQGYAASLAAISERAKSLDEKTMALQYMETLQKLGASDSTKWVIPMEIVNFAQSVMGSVGAGLANTNGREDTRELTDVRN